MNGAVWLPEFDSEMANTRKMLEGVSNEHLDFCPHEKSWTLLELAGHVSNIPNWTAITLTTTELDLAQDWSRDEPTNREEILAEFDAAVAGVRPLLEAVDGRGSTGALDPEDGRRGALHDAPDGDLPVVRPESPHPPSSPTGRVPTYARPAGAVYVRPVGGRKDVIRSTHQRFGPTVKGCRYLSRNPSTNTPGMR